MVYRRALNEEFSRVLDEYMRKAKEAHRLAMEQEKQCKAEREAKERKRREQERREREAAQFGPRHTGSSLTYEDT